MKVSLTVNRTPVADIVPHESAPNPWVPSGTLRRIVEEAGADTQLLADLAEVRGAIVDDA